MRSPNSLYEAPGDTLAIRVPVDGVSSIPKATPVPSQSLVRAWSEPSKKKEICRHRAYLNDIYSKYLCDPGYTGSL